MSVGYMFARWTNDRQRVRNIAPWFDAHRYHWRRYLQEAPVPRWCSAMSRRLFVSLMISVLHVSLTASILAVVPGEEHSTLETARAACKEPIKDLRAAAITEAQ